MLWHLPSVIRLYVTVFFREQLMDILHPLRRQYPSDFDRFVRDMLIERWWTLAFEQYLEVLVVEDGTVVGFAWWRRSWPDDESRRKSEGWFTLRRWASLFVLAYLRFLVWLWPYRSAEPKMGNAVKEIFAGLQPLFASPPSRKKAWNLLTLAVDPRFQKQGLGTQLVEEGLRRVDKAGVSAWLLSMHGLEPWYGSFGFVEKGRANIGDFAKWEGGAVMFRENED